jgi:hypothetical protein
MVWTAAAEVSRRGKVERRKGRKQKVRDQIDHAVFDTMYNNREMGNTTHQHGGVTFIYIANMAGYNRHVHALHSRC